MLNHHKNKIYYFYNLAAWIQEDFRMKIHMMNLEFSCRI